MRLAVICLLAACTKPAARSPSTRSPEELARQVHAFAIATKNATPPKLGDPAFVQPPSDGELAWINDRTKPVADRVERSNDLFDDERTILHAYSDPLVAEALAHPDTVKDTPEGLAWNEGCVRSYAHILDLMLDEFMPTVSRTDGKWQNRVEGLQQVEQGALGMLQGALIALNARRVDVSARRELLAEWIVHVASYRKLWTAEDCTKIQGWLYPIVVSEKDPTLLRDLQQLAASVQGCKGVVP